MALGETVRPDTVERILASGTLAELAAEAHRIDVLAPDLPVVRVHIVRNYTVEPLLPFLKLWLFRRGLSTRITVGDYDVLEQAFLSPDAALAEADVVVLSLWLDTLDPQNQDVFWDSGPTQARIIKLFEVAREHCRRLIVANTFVRPPYSDTGITPPLVGRSRMRQIDQLNRTIEDYVAANADRFVLADWNMLAARVGEAEWYDARFWYTARAPFKRRFLSAYAGELAAMSAALKGRSKKVLVLDCDNTLWGGIVGEDGLAGIKLDPHDYPGNVFYAFQRAVLNLMQRGVMVALNSRNNEADVFDVLDSHPHCLLKRSHLSAWRVNWADKVSNLHGLAADLNVGIDSFVFVDDNPVECDLVREVLPEVTVLQVPPRLYDYPDVLLAHGWFDTLTFSREDSSRTQMYQQESERKQDAVRFANVDEYLASLQMVATIHRLAVADIPRVAQLTQKTNQFNSTTLRFSEEDVRRMSADDDRAIYTMRVTDRFGDSGLTGVLFLSHGRDHVVVDNYLMSCRVLGRNLEYRFLQYCLGLAAANWGLDVVAASFAPTARNMQVAEFWARLGFRSDASPGLFSARLPEIRFPVSGYIEVREE